VAHGAFPKDAALVAALFQDGEQSIEQSIDNYMENRLRPE
jgi:hypothetical protein